MDNSVEAVAAREGLGDKIGDRIGQHVHDAILVVASNTRVWLEGLLVTKRLAVSGSWKDGAIYFSLEDKANLKGK